MRRRLCGRKIPSHASYAGACAPGAARFIYTGMEVAFYTTYERQKVFAGIELAQHPGSAPAHSDMEVLDFSGAVNNLKEER